MLKDLKKKTEERKIREENKKRKWAEKQRLEEERRIHTLAEVAHEIRYIQELATKEYQDRIISDPFVVGGKNGEVRSVYEAEVTAAEADLLALISDRFDPYFIFVDTYLKRGDGKMTQIDIIAIAPQGIIVIESKGMDGQIRGRVDSKTWSRINAQSGEEIRFQNPINQNSMHIDVLCRWLGLDSSRDTSFSGRRDKCPLPGVFSLVVFNNGAKFRDVKFPPDQCYVLTVRRVNDVLDAILSGDEVFSKEKMIGLAYGIRLSRVVPTKEIRQAHIDEIRKSIGVDRVLE
jgi:hypothetical protein